MRSFHAAVPEAQRGHWQVYKKVRGCWLPIGVPLPRIDAQAKLADMLLTMEHTERAQSEPHAVPL